MAADALLDYCCYGAVLSRVLLGARAGVTAVEPSAKTDHRWDNAVLLMQYQGHLHRRSRLDAD